MTLFGYDLLCLLCVFSLSLFVSLGACTLLSSSVSIILNLMVSPKNNVGFFFYLVDRVCAMTSIRMSFSRTFFSSSPCMCARAPFSITQNSIHAIVYDYSSISKKKDWSVGCTRLEPVHTFAKRQTLRRDACTTTASKTNETNEMCKNKWFGRYLQLPIANEVFFSFLSSSFRIQTIHMEECTNKLCNTIKQSCGFLFAPSDTERLDYSEWMRVITQRFDGHETNLSVCVRRRYQRIFAASFGSLQCHFFVGAMHLILLYALHNRPSSWTASDALTSGRLNMWKCCELYKT